MAIVFCDSFNLYAASADLLEGVWAEKDNCSLSADPDGVSTQYCLKFTAGFDGLVRYPLQTATDVLGVAARWWMSSLPANNDQRPHVINWRDDDNTEVGYLTIDTSGRLSFYWCQSGGSYGTPTLVASTTSPNVTAEGWWHIEVKIDTATPRCTVKVEGTTVLDENATFTNHASYPGSIYQIQLEGHDDVVSAGPASYVKDLVVWDDSGSQNNDFLGKVAVYTCRPDGDDTSAWTQSTGSVSWSLLDNRGPDDATYISASSALTEILDMSALPTTVSTVKAVTTWVRAAKDDAGDATLQMSINSGTATDAGTDHEITIAQIWWIDISELDPNTASAWTRTTVDASKLKIDRTS